MKEIVITEENHFKNLILSWSNKFRRQLVDTSRPVKMKYSKKLEMFTLYLSYGITILVQKKFSV